MSSKRTINYFVWLRALGAVAIVLLHAFVTLHLAGQGQILGPRLRVEETISIVLTRWAVPVFFMMSGALMLDPEREMGWRKTLSHVWRLGFVLLTFGYAFCLIEIYLSAGVLNGRTALTALINLLHEKSWDHMWFVYQLLGFYLMTPFIRPWIAQASREEYERVSLVTCLLFFGARFASAFFPFIFYYGVYLPQCFAYYLIGLYVHRYLTFDRRWAVAGVVSVVATVVGAVFLHWDWAAEPVRGLIAPYSIAVMLAAKRYLEKPVESRSIVAVLADYSFGIYLIHPAFQHALVRLFDMVALPAVVADLAMALVPLLLSVVFIAVIRMIPGFKGKV